MLQKGLGRHLLRHAGRAQRFIDLFCGSSAVAWYVAEHSKTEVVANDLQRFSTVLAGAVLLRKKTIGKPARLWNSWVERALDAVYGDPVHLAVEKFQLRNWKTDPAGEARRAREICGDARGYSLTRSYGGYYFSPKQALYLDAMRSTLPKEEPERSLALGALIMASSECAASPGHTAQPFKPTQSGSQYLFEAWNRDVLQKTRQALEFLGAKCAKRKGMAIQGNAIELARQLTCNDVAFIDPPYSGVHYSRFYHVLEMIARGVSFNVEGEGRYPPATDRPKSDFSLRGRSEEAIDSLLGALASRGVRSILTFPKEESSNGLSGSKVKTIADRYFRTRQEQINGKFSTLGGNLIHRNARVPSYEIVLTMTPR